jgi:hypothetical protein
MSAWNEHPRGMPIRVLAQLIAVLAGLFGASAEPILAILQEASPLMIVKGNRT